jgi:hypothetical protein
MKTLPIGIQTFREIIEDGHIYIDKTESIYNLIRGPKVVFLSRPRRFGKSLLVSTLKSLFLGHRDLFQGLWISASSDYDFAPYPVILLDMSKPSSDSPEKLESDLASELKKIARKENLVIEPEASPGAFLSSLIEEMHNKYRKKVVVLIDEYESPIISQLHNPDLSNANRMILRSFYGVLKGNDEYLRFIFVTGIIKVSQASIFSVFNHVTDISLYEKYANICGITIKEFEDYLTGYLREALPFFNKKDPKRPKMTIEELRLRILDWYDGYSWDGKTKALNPWSLFHFLDEKKFKNYWFGTGTPFFLINLIKNSKLSLSLFNKEVCSFSGDIEAVEIEEMEPISTMFQTGYLTIESIYGPESSDYTLKFPNL